MDNIDFARNNEEFSNEVEDDYPDQKNWVVTIRFYSFIHFVESSLNNHGYRSDHHNERKENILNCPAIDDRARKIYRLFEDLSRDARYECVQMSESDVRESETKLEEGKRVLGYIGSGGGSTKYST